MDLGDWPAAKQSWRRLRALRGGTDEREAHPIRLSSSVLHRPFLRLSPSPYAILQEFFSGLFKNFRGQARPSLSTSYTDISSSHAPSPQPTQLRLGVPRHD
jgi:hypothetical protein